MDYSNDAFTQAATTDSASPIHHDNNACYGLEAVAVSSPPTVIDMAALLVGLFAIAIPW